MANTQKPEKRIPIHADGLSVEVHSIFHTIQGEGIFAGTPAVFVRLAGCNLQCPECDTEYTQGRRSLSPSYIIGEVEAAKKGKKTSLVVITGGEPFRQRIGALISGLTQAGFCVQVETNGSLFDESVNYRDKDLYIVCSPKTGHVNEKLLPHIDAFKYVGGCNENELPYDKTTSTAINKQIQDHGLMEDGLPRKALGHSAKPHLYRPPADYSGWIFLQPIDRKNDQLNAYHQKAVVESCLKNGYTLCLQIHKIIEVE